MNHDGLRIIGLKVLDDSPKYLSKVLSSCTTYFFIRGYEDVPGSHFVRRAGTADDELKLYDVAGHEGRKINVAVSAVVGRNGEGKSTVIELLLRLINNFAYSTGFRATQETLKFVTKMSVAMFYEVDDTIYSIRCDNEGLKWFEGEKEIDLYGMEDDEKLQHLRNEHRQKLFYTLVVNYALYSYNSRHFDFESDGEGCWLDGLFYKNDAYQTPLVITPMRTEGNIDVNTEYDLSQQRLMAIFTEAGDDKEQRTVSDGVIAHGFGFNIDKRTKLLDITLARYFKNVEDDECHFADLEGEDLEDAAKNLICNFNEFFVSLLDIFDKHKRLYLWLVNYGATHQHKHSETELSRYIDIMAESARENQYDYPYDLDMKMKSFMSDGKLRWMNSAQLYRVLLVVAVWEELRKLVDLKLDESLDSYIAKDSMVENKAVLYLPYKVLEIMQTYLPYKNKSYLYDKSCSALKMEWPTPSVRKAIAKDVKKILETDDYTTFKLHQTITYLREQRGMYNAQAMPWSPEGYQWLIPFDSLKKEIFQEGQRLTPMLKKLLPPVFKGEIILMDSEGNMFPLSSLSSGQLQKLNSAGSLVYHLRNLDYRVKEADRIEYDFVTIILEEVELYFHPEYQRTLIDYFLKQIGRAKLKHINGIHLIFVTHSPFILSDLSNKNVLYLSKDGRQPQKESFAANIYDLLDDHFFLDETIGQMALGKIAEMVEFYRKDDEESRKDGTEQARRNGFLRKEKDFRLLIDMLAEGYIKDDVSRMYYELASKYMPERVDDEIERTKRRLDELIAVAKREENDGQGIS